MKNPAIEIEYDELSGTCPIPPTTFNVSLLGVLIINVYVPNWEISKISSNDL